MANSSSMPGRSTLTATSRPSVVIARWTCAIDAAPTGTSSNSEKRLSRGAPNERSIVCLIFANGAGGRSSCSCDRFAAAFSPTRSGRVESAWPSLIAAGPDRQQRRGIVGRRRDARAEARNSRQPPDRRRRHRVVLDAAQRAVPGQRPAPLQQTPQMGDRRGQIFQPEWIVTSPPSIGSAAARTKPASPTIALNALGLESGGCFRPGSDSCLRHRRRPCRCAG